MWIYFRYILILFSIQVSSLNLSGQFAANGTAMMIDDQCFGFSPTSGFPGGSIWHLDLFDLTDTLDVNFQVVFGCPGDVGNEGLIFAFQVIGAFAGNYNGALGFEKLEPSIGVEFDLLTDPELGDPEFDHMTIFWNGDFNHDAGNGLPPPQFILEDRQDLQDCLPHDLRFRWLPLATMLEVYVDCTLRLSYRLDIVNNIFGGRNEVFWGVTSSSRDEASTMIICPEFSEQLDILEDVSVCQGTEISLKAPITGQTYQWSPGIHLNDSTIQEPNSYYDSDDGLFRNHH